MTTPPPLAWPASILATRGPIDDRVPHPGQVPGVAARLDADASLAQFTAACEAVGGLVHQLSRVDEIVALIAGLCAPPLEPRLLAWAEAEMPVPGLYAAFQAAGLVVEESTVGTDAESHRADLARLDGAAVGVTGAIAVLADTGSLVVTSGRGRPRLASLLPPVHVALVTRAQLVPSLGVWMAANSADATARANCVVITGPSRTADIEMTLTRGVHGPRVVHVVFVA